MIHFHVYICQEYLKVKLDAYLVLLTILLHNFFEYIPLSFILQPDINLKIFNLTMQYHF